MCDLGFCLLRKLAMILWHTEVLHFYVKPIDLFLLWFPTYLMFIKILPTFSSNLFIYLLVYIFDIKPNLLKINSDKLIL